MIFHSYVALCQRVNFPSALPWPAPKEGFTSPEFRGVFVGSAAGTLRALQLQPLRPLCEELQVHQVAGACGRHRVMGCVPNLVKVVVIIIIITITVIINIIVIIIIVIIIIVIIIIFIGKTGGTIYPYGSSSTFLGSVTGVCFWG